MSTLANLCKAINNASRAGKRQLMFRFTGPVAKRFLLEMLRYGYIKSFSIVEDNVRGKYIIGLNGRLNKCGAICPRYHVAVKDMEKYRNKLLPARQFGHVIFQVGDEIMDHNAAIANNKDGRILGFFF